MTSARAIFFTVGVLAACRPDLGERESRVDRTKVIAVLVEPPDAMPGQEVTATVVVASPDGPVTASAEWALCATPRLLTENGSVSTACQANGVVPLGGAPAASVTLPLPSDACAAFGPEIQAAEVRPRDPDSTGGFFAPIRALVVTAGGGPLTAFGFARLRCGLANASAENVQAFAARYAPNRSPVPSRLAAAPRSGAPAGLDAIAPGDRVVLRASWRPEDAEVYAYYDPAALAVVDRREGMRVTWLASAGDFDADRTGRADTEAEVFTDNTWTAPPRTGLVHVWAVLRDTRGGTAALYETLVVR
ncbi:MAG: hypothetical protein JWP97_2687 [Labilithrix sp.]|nr:hypothetical protein [Labilithrix sp.]